MSDKTAVASLRTVAERVGLARCTVSAILNRTPASKAIPERTKDRVFRAVTELNYRPNLWARSLRTKRTWLVAAVTSDIGLAPVARVLAGAESLLHRRGYLLALGSWDCRAEWHSVSVQLRQRGIEGVIAIDAPLPPDLALPVASVDLNCMALLEPLADDTRTGLKLKELGESAAETLLRQIEKKDPVSRAIGSKTVPRFPPAYFDRANATVAVEKETREGA